MAIERLPSGLVLSGGSLFFTEETMPDFPPAGARAPCPALGRAARLRGGASPSWICRRMLVGSSRRRTT